MTNKIKQFQPLAGLVAGALLVAAVGLNPANATQANVDAGAIDKPLKDTSAKKLQQDVKKEQKELAKLDRNALKQKAEKGERLAQVQLGADYAKEAAMLSFSPAAANDALSDAAQWYSLAAQRGYPGAPSLDNSGIAFFPIRAYR